MFSFVFRIFCGIPFKTEFHLNSLISKDEKTLSFHTINQRTHTFSEKQNFQLLESQTFLKIPFLASPRIGFVVVSGAYKNPNSQCRAGARRSQEIPRDRHIPVWALAVWWFGKEQNL
jgi:hypothetical protein